MDIIIHMVHVCELYFAKPDALQGTIMETILWARPTVFFAVPRIWEKFEEKLKEAAMNRSWLATKISSWAKSHGAANTRARMRNEDPPLLYPLAKAMILDRIKQAIGLD